MKIKWINEMHFCHWTQTAAGLLAVVVVAIVASWMGWGTHTTPPTTTAKAELSERRLHLHVPEELVKCGIQSSRAKVTVEIHDMNVRMLLSGTSQEELAITFECVRGVMKNHTLSGSIPRQIGNMHFLELTYFPPGGKF